eukprot:jgi/Chrzof1/11370/Cz05g34100.t1
MHAIEASHPDAKKIPGLQEFAAAVWDRRRRIPSQTYNDALDHIFNEFDIDSDGHLTAVEIAQALQSRGVDASADVVQEFIDVTDSNGNGMVERHEFSKFIFELAKADLRVDSGADARE